MKPIEHAKAGARRLRRGHARSLTFALLGASTVSFVGLAGCSSGSSGSTGSVGVAGAAQAGSASNGNGGQGVGAEGVGGGSAPAGGVSGSAGGMIGTSGAGAGGRGSGGTGNGSSGGAGAADSGGNGAGGGVASASCPPSPPANGSVCAPETGDAGRCTWGDSARPDCRTVGTCTGTWHVVAPPAYCSGLDPACPTSMPSDFATCSATSMACVYSTTLCSCSPCNSTGVPGPPFIHCNGQPLGTPVWDCNSAAIPASPCPSAVPNRGAACSLPVTTGCPAGTCGDLNVTCNGGVWTWTYPPVTCPACFRQCATCASPGTPIATPTGERPIAEIRVGDLVYSVVDNAILAVPVIRVTRTPVVNHHVVRVTTTDGRILEISAGHPTADGRVFGDLRQAGLLDGHAIDRVETVPYSYAQTYDILPASETGSYFAAGMLIGSTLAR